MKKKEFIAMIAMSIMIFNNNRVNYFQTPAAFYKKKKIKLGNSDKADQWG